MMFIRPVPNSIHARKVVDDSATLDRVRRVLKQCGTDCDTVELLAVGGQARLLLARRRGHPPLVVKCFDPSVEEARTALDDAYDAMMTLRPALDGKLMEGWTIRCPRPLHKSPGELALVMTLAEGRSVYRMFADASFDLEWMNGIADAVAAALRCFWSATGRPYGDINPHNVLADAATKSLWLLDCGLPDRQWLCEGVSAQFASASRDLGYLLYFAASSVRATLSRPALRRRQQAFCERIVRSCTAAVPAPARSRMLVEIESCARVHLQGIGVSASAAGLWRWVVRRQATHTLGRALHRLRTAPAEHGPAEMALCAAETTS